MSDGTEQTRLITRPFVAVTAATFAFFVYVGVLVPLVPTYVEHELGAGELGIGLAIAAFAIVAIAVRPLIGRLIVRHGRRAVMIGGALLATASGVGYGFADALPLLLLMRGLTGAGEAALFVAAMTLIADLSPSHRRAEAASYFSVAVYGGLGIGPVVGEVMLADSGYRTAFALAGVFAAVAALLSIAVPSRVVVLPTDAPHEIEPGGSVDRRRWTRFVHPNALGPGLVLAAAVASFAVFSAFLPDYSRSVGMSSSGGLFAVYSAVCLVLRVAGARLPERLGPRTSVSTALVMVAVGLALMATIAQPWALWLAAGFVGLGMAFNYPSLVALTVNRTSVEERPWAISSFSMFFEVGMATGGLALGGVAEVFGKRAGFAAGVVVCAVGLWFVRTVVIPAPTGRRDDRHEPAPQPFATVTPD